MKRMQQRGFSLVELLVVTTIIAILAGMIALAANAARKRAYATQARVEAQQIVTAFRSYWVARGRWPTGFESGYDDPLTQDKLFASDLMGGGGDDVTRSAFLEISTEDFGGSAAFLDPWGVPYQLKIQSSVEVEQAETFQVVVGFVNAEKHYYQD